MRFFSFKKVVSPFWQLALFLILTPILELALMLNFSFWWLTYLSMFVSGLLGVIIAKWQGDHHWIQLHQQLDRRENPSMHIINLVLISLGAMLMILPGIVTSLFGLFLLMPFTRLLFASYILLQFEIYRLQTKMKDVNREPEIIDV